MFYNFKMYYLYRYFFYKDDESFRKKNTFLFCRLSKLSKLVGGFIGMIMFLEGVVYKII